MKIKTLYLGLSVLVFAIINFNCASKFRLPEIRAIELVSQSQFAMMESGKIYSQVDTSVLAYVDSLVIYREQYYNIKYNKKALQGNTFVISNDTATIEKKEKRYDYFIWKEGDKKGLKYSGDDNSPKPIDVDSIYIKKLFKNARFYNVSHDRLAKVDHEKDVGSYLETYVNVTKPDESYCDTTLYRFSSKYSDIPYSLSKEADNLKKSKLVEVRYIYNPVDKGISATIDLPRREMVYKMNRVEMQMTENLKSMINKFKAASGINK